MPICPARTGFRTFEFSTRPSRPAEIHLGVAMKLVGKIFARVACAVHQCRANGFYRKDERIFEHNIDGRIYRTRFRGPGSKVQTPLGEVGVARRNLVAVGAPTWTCEAIPADLDRFSAGRPGLRRVESGAQGQGQREEPRLIRPAQPMNVATARRRFQKRCRAQPV